MLGYVHHLHNLIIYYVYFTNHNILNALLLYKSNSIRIDTKAFVTLLLAVLEIKFITSHWFNSIGSRKIVQLQISPDFLR